MICGSRRITGSWISRAPMKGFWWHLHVGSSILWCHLLGILELELIFVSFNVDQRSRRLPSWVFLRYRNSSSSLIKFFLTCAWILLMGTWNHFLFILFLFGLVIIRLREDYRDWAITRVNDRWVAWNEQACITVCYQAMIDNSLQLSVNFLIILKGERRLVGVIPCLQFFKKKLRTCKNRIL